ncbi:MAG: hypothetical protein IJ668_08185, partial [Selenomonadaceae bacterium]|nr:hypothetical protein [Selenomonadaceae bacterium]
YLNREYGFWCAWNKLYSRRFLMENNIFYTPASHERGFTFKCMLYAERYVKVPLFLNIYREGIQSASRRPPSLDIVSGKPMYFSKFAADFENIMKDFAFFEERPDYKYRVIDAQLSEFDPIEVLPYYPNAQVMTPEFIKAFGGRVSKDFEEYAAFVSWLFHRYHLMYRRNLELTARIQQLEAQLKTIALNKNNLEVVT